MRYQYDAAGNRVKMTTPEGKMVQYRYNAANRLDQIASFLGTFDFSYDASGRRTGLTYPNWVTTSYSYDSVGQLTAILSQATGSRHGKGHGDTVSAISYLLDPVGNRTSKTLGSGEHRSALRYDYTYDALYQLTESVAVMEGKGKPFQRRIEGYAYDPVGNRLSGPFQSDTYTHNEVNELLTKGKTTYRYDLNGNMIARGEWRYEYDYENRMIKATRADRDEVKVVSFKYDPFGRRIEKKVEEIEGGKVKGKTYTYVYDNEDIILEYRVGSDGDDDDHQGRAKISRFVHGPGIDEPLAVEQKGKVYYYHADGLGSIVSLTDSKGRVVESFDYSAFGFMQRQGSEVKQPYAYTRREWDKELGLYYYRARYYDPVIGRFISKDPIGFAGGDVNLYRYVGNDPVSKIDPYGLFEWVNPVTYWGDFSKGAGDFLTNYQKMRDANTIGADAYFHCMANCQASRRGAGGRDAAELISEGRELADEYLKGNPPSDCDADRASNRQGRNGAPDAPCSQVCGSLRPNNLDPRY